MKENVAVLGTLRFPSERVAEVLPHLKTLVETTYKNDGCIAYDVAEDPFDSGLIRFSELWSDQISLDNYPYKYINDRQQAGWNFAATQLVPFCKRHTF